MKSMKLTNLRKMVIRSVCVMLLTLAVFGVSVASPGYNGLGEGGKFMAFFDSNNDDIVTLAELNSASISRFEKMDTDGNAVVTRAEFENHIQQRRMDHKDAIYKEVDENADGQVSRDEFLSFKQKRAEYRFQKMDKNKDGFVSADEFVTKKHRRHGKKASHGGKKHIFSRIDVNKDEQLTQDENITAWTKWFRRIDVNADQIVTLQEVQDFRRNKHSGQKLPASGR